jgi:uncharacterized protein (DUF1501 family)
MRLSRRTVLGAGASLVAASQLPRRAWAQPAAEKATVVIIFLQGGYNAVFGGADAYVPTNGFGATADNVLDVGNGLVVDRSTLGALPEAVRAHMATVGIYHGMTGHDAAQPAMFTGKTSYPLALARAFDSGAPLTCVSLAKSPPGGHTALGKVALTVVGDVAVPIQLISGEAGSDEPSRENMLRGVLAARALSTKTVQRNPHTLQRLAEGYDALGNALAQPVRPLDWASISAAYGIAGGATQVKTLQEQFAAAELMVDAGVDVVLLPHSVGGGDCNPLGWDTHNDGDASCNRALFQKYLGPMLPTFLTRMLDKPGRNVVTVVMGEFARTVPSAGHAPFNTPTVFGKYLRAGTTGRPVALGRGQIGLPPETPGIQQFWSFLAAAARAPTNPFGANPHGALLAL